MPGLFDLGSLFGSGGGGINWGGMGNGVGNFFTNTVPSAATWGYNNLLPSSSNPNYTWGNGVAALSSLAGATTGGMQLERAAQMQRQLESLSHQPYNVDQFYNPMSSTAMAALQRTGAANAVAQGLTPDQWQRTFGPELQAKTETERWSQAQQMAMQMRQQQIAALSGRPQLPSIGDIGAFGNATMANQLRQERLAATQRNDANFNRMLGLYDPSRWGNWGSNASVQQPNVPYYLSNTPNPNWGMPNYGYTPGTTAGATESPTAEQAPDMSSKVPNYDSGVE